jgi:uncharacterized protein (DUF433 family)
MFYTDAVAEAPDVELFAFSAKRARRLTGLTIRQIQYWDEIGFITPSLTSRKGRGRKRLYSFRDLVALESAAQLRGQGVPLQRLRKVNDYLRELDYRDPFAELRFWSVGDSLYFDEGGLLQDGRQLGQTVASYVVPVGKIAEGLKHQVELDHERARRSGTIERRRGVLGRRPVLAGTRIAVESIQNLARDGASQKEILEAYLDLTKEDVEAALKVELPRRRKRAS